MLAEDAPKAPPPGGMGGNWGFLLVMVGAFAVLYFLIIYPQRKKEKARQHERETMLSALKKNDHVMTIGGIHGIVASVTDQEVALKIDERNDVRIRVSREAISKVVTAEDEKKASEEKGTGA